MSARWTPDEDAFLLRYHHVGPRFIASHDLGRPASSGPRRLKKLRETGASRFFAKAQIAMLEYHMCLGMSSGEREQVLSEMAYWKQEAWFDD